MTFTGQMTQPAVLKQQQNATQYYSNKSSSANIPDQHH